MSPCKDDESAETENGDKDEVAKKSVSAQVNAGVRHPRLFIQSGAQVT